MYLENQEALDNDESVINNAHAELLTIDSATDVTIINGGTFNTTIINDDATNPSRSINYTVVNGSPTNTTVVNGDATSSSLNTPICTIDTPVANGSTADTAVTNGDATGYSSYRSIDATVL